MTHPSEDILQFWFGPDSSQPAAAQQRMPLWFGSDADLDEDIRRRFAGEVQAALAGERQHWLGSARPCLALILLLDQFPRNLFRGHPEAFSGDSAALAACLQGLEEELDQALTPIERGFFLLPMQHAEDLAHQQRSVELYRQLLEQSPPDWQPLLQGMLDYALEHRDIIQRFGRFPHRNPLLGRPPTLEEEAFLADGGPRYGQG